MRYKNLNRIAKYNSFLIKLFEKSGLNKYGRESSLAPIFIVGAPRTGSTILYQLLTNYLKLSYTDNLVNLFYRNIYFGFWLSEFLFKGKSHYCFNSRFGNTEKCGLHAPNESGRFWYQWFPKENHFLSKDSIPNNSKIEISQKFNSILNRYKKPLLIKNLNMGQRLQLIHDIFPKAKVIFIKRDPVYTAQSIYNAKIKQKISLKSWWSVRPKNYKDLIYLNDVKQVVCQVYYCEKQITDDLKLFTKEQVTTIDYNDLCKNTLDTVGLIKEFLKTDYKTKDEILNLKKIEKQTLEDGVFNLIKSKVTEFDWINYAN